MTDCRHGIEQTHCAYCNPRAVPSGYEDDPVGELYDYAVSRPEGFTWAEAVDELGWSRPKFEMTKRRLRLLFADDDINLVCESTGLREPWVHRLVGTYDEAKLWIDNRVADMESRLETVQAVSATVVRAIDGRSIQGRRARKIERTLSYLLSELGEMDAA